MSNSTKNVKKLQTTAAPLKNVHDVRLWCNLTAHSSVTWDVFNQSAFNYVIGFRSISKLTIRLAQLSAWIPFAMGEEYDKSYFEGQVWRLDRKLGVKGRFDRYVEWEHEPSVENRRFDIKQISVKDKSSKSE
jgi:hypothetical protein